MAYALLCLLAAAIAFWMARYMSTEMRNNRDWPTVPGKILERGVGEPMGTVGRSYLPHVKYTYSVAGKEYTNDQVYLIRRTGGIGDKMQELVDSLPDPVPVHFNPRDPAQSYLLVNPWGTYWILIGMGVFAVVMALMWLITSIASAQTYPSQIVRVTAEPAGRIGVGHTRTNSMRRSSCCKQSTAERAG